MGFFLSFFSSFLFLSVLGCIVISSLASLPVNAGFFFLYSIKPRACWPPCEKAELMKRWKCPETSFCKNTWKKMFFQSQSWMFVAAQQLRERWAPNLFYSDHDTHVRSISGRVISPSTSSAFNWLCLYKNVCPKDRSIKHCISAMCFPCHDEKMRRAGMHQQYLVRWSSETQRQTGCLFLTLM